MGFSFSHLLLVLIVVLIVFGAGKLPRVMGDLGKGVRSFREGLKAEDEAENKTPKQITHTQDSVAVRAKKDEVNL